MGQNITAIRIDRRPGTVSVRALSENRRGSKFTKRGLTASYDSKQPRPHTKILEKMIFELWKSVV